MEVKEDKYFAEIVGIILGDGNLYDSGRHYILGISINHDDNPKYVKYVNDLIERVLKISPKILFKKNSKNIELRIFNKELVKFLQNKGLEAGNKVTNQVKIPEWILSNNEYCISCIRGLLDTDGSIYINKSNLSININFKNSSLPLIEGFQKICYGLGISTSKIRINDKNKRSSYRVSIGAREQVAKFIYLVKPMKWFFNLNKFKKELKSVNLTLSDIFYNKKLQIFGNYSKKLLDLN